MIDELDVAEVLDGFPPPAGMSTESKIEALRRLDERAREFKYPRMGPTALAGKFGVTPRTVSRWRQAIRLRHGGGDQL